MNFRNHLPPKGCRQGHGAAVLRTENGESDMDADNQSAKNHHLEALLYGNLQGHRNVNVETMRL